MLKKLVCTLSLLLMVVMFFGACTKKTETPTTSPAVTTSVEKITPKGSATIAMSDMATMPIDPAYGAGGATWYHIFALNAHLMTADPMTGKITPSLAESWEVGPDLLTWTFHIRKGLKFHSGNPLTAQDFVYSYNKMVVDGIGLASNITSIKNFYENIWAEDDYTLKAKTKVPNVLMIGEQYEGKSFNDIPCPIDSKYIKQVGYDEFIKHPSLSGPYKLVEQKLGEYAKFEAFDDFWPQPGYVKSLTYTIIPETSTQLAALKTGLIDVMMNVSGPVIQEIKNDPALTLFSFGPSSAADIFLTDYYFPDQPSPILDKRVRQAMAYAIDRQAIVDKIYYGQATVMPLPSFHEVQFGYDKTLKGYDYNPTKAKALLKEAGYAEGFKYTLYARTANLTMSQAVAGYWQDIGITTEVKLTDGAIFSRDMTAKAIKTGGAFTSGGMVPWDVGFRLREYYCPPNKGGSGWSFCDNPFLTEKITQMLGTFNNEPLRETQMKAILAIIADELPSRIGVISPNRMFAYGKTVESAVPGLGGGWQYPQLLKLK